MRVPYVTLVGVLAMAGLGYGPVSAHQRGDSAPDPSRETVLIGEAELEDVRIKLELEPAAAMTIPMGGAWMDMVPTADQRYHVEVKPEDPRSNTRVPYASVRFVGTNHATGEVVELELHPMWGSSGLHYGANSDLPDGTYSATVTVGVPLFARGSQDRERWMEPQTAQFEFRLEGGLVVSATVAGAGQPAPTAAP